MSFEAPDAKKVRSEESPPKPRSHVPKEQSWNTAAVLATARSWPAGKRVNWSAMARQHNVPGANGGQAIKEYLRTQGVDVLAMEQRATIRTRQRSKKLKFGCGVSFPAIKSSA